MVRCKQLKTVAFATATIVLCVVMVVVVVIANLDGNSAKGRKFVLRPPAVALAAEHGLPEDATLLRFALAWNDHCRGRYWSLSKFRDTAPLLDYACEQLPLYRRTLVLAVANSAMRSLTFNWLVSLHRVGFNLKHILIICVDEPCYRSFHATGLHVLQLTPEMLRELEWDAAGLDTKGSNDMLPWGDPVYQRLMQIKMRIPHYLVRHGFTVFFQDVDLVFLRRKPSHAIDAVIDLLDNTHPNISMIFQQDWGVDQRNCGFFIARPAPASLLILDRTVQLMRDSLESSRHAGRSSKGHRLEPVLDDQAALNHVLRHDNLSWATADLDTREFVAGRQIFNLEMGTNDMLAHWQDLAREAWQPPTRADLPYIIHANAVWKHRKINALREWHLWWADDRASMEAAGLPLEGANATTTPSASPPG